MTIKSATNPQIKLGLILEEEVTAPSLPKSDKRVEFGLVFSDELLRTSLMVESLLNLEQKHEMVTAISVEVFPGVLQTEQMYIAKWREAIEAEMNIRHSETYCRPSGSRYLVGSTLAPMCKSRYPDHFVAVDVKNTRTIVDQAFSVPKCVRLTRMSEKSYGLLCKMFSAVPERTKEELESILGKKFMGYVSGNFSDFERQKQR